MRVVCSHRNVCDCSRVECHDFVQFVRISDILGPPLDWRTSVLCTSSNQRRLTFPMQTRMHCRNHRLNVPWCSRHTIVCRKSTISNPSNASPHSEDALKDIKRNRMARCLSTTGCSRRHRPTNRSRSSTASVQAWQQTSDSCGYCLWSCSCCCLD